MDRRNRTQWAATYAVALELTRRDYEVGWPMGNAPVKDLIVRSPEGHDFFVDTKGGSYDLSRKGTSGYWHLCQARIVDPAKRRDNLFVIFVRIPTHDNEPLEPLEFFVLSNDDCISLYQQLLQKDRITADAPPGFPRDHLEGFKDAWKKLPK